MRCIGRLTSGRRCPYNAQEDSTHCGIHDPSKARKGSRRAKKKAKKKKARKRARRRR